jgi:hypothetical protein
MVAVADDGKGRIEPLFRSPGAATGGRARHHARNAEEVRR